ncbi:hypothetical protein ACJIZ3_001396 [Penstemon smallii]|uniref:Tudor domain-containing protein n=1 Tax=Penstemon smallii TaxID=265156 RepID=A0ABD3U729_9LAMI
MVPLSVKELEERLKAAGNCLLQPPFSRDELLPLLDRIEELLSKVEQAPAESMRSALSPLLKAVVADKLLKHSDVDVKVGVSSCISEITRITAPDAPYADDQMKDIFQLIVSSFENISDTSSKSHKKRANVLKTMAIVRSCLVMLDLECDQMIVEMFQHFLKGIRDYHAEHIFASMETIMTLVLEESEEISPDLINPILATLKKNNEAVLPIAKNLAERVIQSCADKLRPYLTQAVKTLDVSLDDYEQVVASICYENNRTCGHSNENILKDQSLVAGHTNVWLNEKELGRLNTFTAILPYDSLSRSGKTFLKVIRWISFLYEQVDKDGAEETNPRDIASEYVHGSPSEVPPVEAARSLDKLEDNSIQLSPSETSEDENVNAASPLQSDSLPEENRSKKSGRSKRKVNLISEETLSVGTVSKKASEGENIPKAKKQRYSGEKQPDETNNKDQASTEGVSKNDYGSTSDSETKSLDQTENLGDASNKSDVGSPSRKEDPGKGGRVKPRSKKDISKSFAKEDDDGKDTGTSPRSPLKSPKDKSSKEETPRMSTKRKRTPAKYKASKSTDYGEKLVGSKVRVWWPDDQAFYEGVIASFNSMRKRHKVFYNDGDVEELNLRKELWELVRDDPVSDEGETVELSSHGASSDMQRKKKGTTSEASKSKSKDNGRKAKPNPGGESEDETIKSKDRSQKLEGKSTVVSTKASVRSKNDGPAKTSAQSKQDGLKAAKSKAKTPQSGKTLSSPNGNIMTKPSSSKTKENDRMKEKPANFGKSSEVVKGKSPGTAKSRESETKKRRM